MFKILSKRRLNPTMTWLVIDAPLVAKKPDRDSLSSCVPMSMERGSPLRWQDMMQKKERSI